MQDSEKLMLVILKRSIESEDAGNDFYEKLVEETTEPEGKEILTKLAVEENNHERDLRAKYDEIARRCGWEPFDGAASFKFLDHVGAELPFLSDDDKSPSFADTAHLSGTEALKFAIQVEKASADYFMHAAIAVEQSDAKLFFADLAKLEINHALILEKELLRLAMR